MGAYGAFYDAEGNRSSMLQPLPRPVERNQRPIMRSMILVRATDITEAGQFPPNTDG